MPDYSKIKKVVLNGDSLSLEQVLAVARFHAKVSLNPQVKNKIYQSWQIVQKIIKNKQKVYGVTTGFGKHASIFLEDQKQAAQLQENIILSHIVGVGDFLDDESVRAMLLLRANTLAKGYSGVRYELVKRIIDMVNASILPQIPEKGSVGASGDLTPLGYMALALIGKGKVKFQNKIMSAQTAFRKAKLSPTFQVSYKEGLALTNGTTFMAALGVLTYLEALNLIKNADIAAALSTEAICGRSRAFDLKLHQTRPYTGQILSAKNLNKLFQKSTLIDRGPQVQDSYSIRCIPQVHGASWEALEFVRKILETEINSAIDNPLFFQQKTKPLPFDKNFSKLDYSGGNFHGQPLALALDFLAIALSEIGNISERRIQKLLDENHNCGLPSNLTFNPGLNSGLMVAQYTAAALVSENKILSHPASVDSIPTSSNIEDHVSMGSISALKAKKVLENVQNIISIEYLCAAQALDFRQKKILPLSRNQIITGTPGIGTKVAYQAIRSQVSTLKVDRPLDADIARIKKLILSGEILNKTEKVAGKIYQ